MTRTQTQTKSSGGSEVVSVTDRLVTCCGRSATWRNISAKLVLPRDVACRRSGLPPLSCLQSCARSTDNAWRTTLLPPVLLHWSPFWWASALVTGCQKKMEGGLESELCPLLALPVSVILWCTLEARNICFHYGRSLMLSSILMLLNILVCFYSLTFGLCVCARGSTCVRIIYIYFFSLDYKVIIHHPTRLHFRPSDALISQAISKTNKQSVKQFFSCPIRRTVSQKH